MNHFFWFVVEKEKQPKNVMELNLDAILRPIFEKYRDYFASEEVMDTHQSYEVGKLSYFVSSVKLALSNGAEPNFKIWNPVAPLPLQIEEEMKELILQAFRTR